MDLEKYIERFEIKLFKSDIISIPNVNETVFVHKLCKIFVSVAGFISCPRRAGVE